MTAPSVSYEELEALHDVLEAARRFGDQHPFARERAAAVLQTANRFLWRLGEQLPKTGTYSEAWLWDMNHPPEETPGMRMQPEGDTTPSVSYEELEALHDVLEAARCFLNQHPARERAATVLQTANRLYWRLGEQLPKTGTRSERFRAVIHSSDGTPVERLVDIAMDLAREYTNQHDPWWADTVLISKSLIDELPKDGFLELEDALERLGMILIVDPARPDDEMAVERRDVGPWPELAVQSD